LIRKLLCQSGVKADSVTFFNQRTFLDDMAELLSKIQTQFSISFNHSIHWHCQFFSENTHNLNIACWTMIGSSVRDSREAKVARAVSTEIDSV
jgi:Uri superfamily endonuclease